VREFNSDGPRSEGPAVVWVGRDEGPALVVVDPSGAARHEGLPASWKQLADHFQVAWCRVPASKRSLEDVEDVLETLDERQAPTTLVASGGACEAAMVIAAMFSDIVSAVLLVDPPPGVAEAEITGVEVRVVARSHEGATDRVEAPMPLGHPEVVDGLVSALTKIV
jgi:pimeloyl-ACP methyl ester carboxylesterase